MHQIDAEAEPLTASPLILTGSIVAVDEAGWVREGAHGGKVQPFRLRVNVEHVLQGPEVGRRVDIYCFLNRGNWTGPAPMDFSVGELYIFYLRKEASELRTACDVYAPCVDHILTGRHSSFKRNRDRPVADDILQILLTRGDNVSDGVVVDALAGNAEPYLGYGFRWRYQRPETYLKLLQRAAQIETPPVRAEACELLKGLGKPCKPCEVAQ